MGFSDNLPPAVYNPYLWVGLFVLASVLTHGLFAFIWTNPSTMKRNLGGTNRDPKLASKWMATLTVNLRGFTLLAVVGALLTSTGFLTQIDWSSPFTIIGMTLTVFGQVMNTGVYTQLGTYGVYYGRELGVKNLPWSDGFPYNLGIPDPQYVGVELSYVGLAVMTQTMPMIAIAAIGAVAYSITICVERFVTPGEVERKKSK